MLEVKEGDGTVLLSQNLEWPMSRPPPPAVNIAPVSSIFPAPEVKAAPARPSTPQHAPARPSTPQHVNRTPNNSSGARAAEVGPPNSNSSLITPPGKRTSGLC